MLSPLSKASPIRAFVSAWLYGDWSEEKLNQFEFLYHFRGISDYFDYLLDVRNDESYLQNNGMDYSDIYDPRKLHQTSSGARVYGNIVNFFSDNINRLYPD